MTDLWPETIGKAREKSPVAVLREQASLLGRKTGNLVQAEVRGRQSEKGAFRYYFYIVAPALGHYRYELFSITHDITLYPLSVEVEPEILEDIPPGLADDNLAIRADSEDEFLERLRLVFGSKKTERVITALLSQSDLHWEADDDGGSDFGREADDMPF